MANCGKDILSARKGTGQMQRYIDALNPDSIKLNDFDLKEWMQFAFRFAEHVNYFDISNSEIPASNWQEFFMNDTELDAFLKSVDEGGDVTPHLALFLSFLKLLEFTKKRFNKLTKRHLDYYYKNILKIEKLPATPDKVHVIFELAKNSIDEKIAENTELDGKKDANGKKLIYKTTEELIANKIKVAQLKSVYNDHENSKIKAADVANSYDGIGGDFPDDEIKWWPFGYYEKIDPLYPDVKPEYPILADAKLGFAVSSEILELQEGLRSIQITIKFSDGLDSITPGILYRNLKIYCSGEKEWLGPYTVDDAVLDENEEQVVFSSNYTSSSKELKLAFQIPKEENAVIKYNSKDLGEYFNTKFPVCRVLINTENEEGHTLYRSLVEKEITDIKINVDVRGIKSLSLENDNGIINAAKPFYPFGTQPVRKSNFYIGYPELFKKEWKSLKVNIEWKNTPDNFKDLYYAYREKYRYKITPSSFLLNMGDFGKVESTRKSITDFGTIEATIKDESNLDNIENIIPREELLDSLETFTVNENELIVSDDAHFKSNIEIKNKEDWETPNELGEFELFTKSEDLFYSEFSIPNVNNRYVTDKNGPVRMSLNQSFYHDLFPRIYALAFSSDEDNVLIPNEPYTPFVETVELAYTAESSYNKNAVKSEYEKNEVILFHEHPFGQTEEHPYLREQHDFLIPEQKLNFLVPTYCKGGELYVGLENVETLQQVSLLIQVLEGSEDPLGDSFVGKQKVEWSVLCQNEWKDLDSTDIISNETDNFLKSGIVKFSIPREATSSNTLLPQTLFWVKAKIHKDFNAVCKTIAIYAQSVLAQFSNNENDLLHLENGLAANTISKLEQRISSVKSIAQPFNSFGGVPVESDELYYRRVSERLRHKNRAITIWDYEHIILQNFSDIHKVKCLSHSSETSFLAPGKVLIVVIPDIINKNVFDIYQPRVSRATLNEIENCVNELNTLHVNAKVINPEYEEVKVDLKVKFHKGYDESYFKKVLGDDITKLLSPWAFEESADIEFGITLHRSILINYIEKLEYVDYIEDVFLLKNDEISTTNIAPSSPKAILVSAKKHNISAKIKICNGKTETIETCQT